MEATLVPRVEVNKLGRPTSQDHQKRAFTMAMAAWLEGQTPNTKLAYRAAIRQFFGLFGGISPDEVTIAHAIGFKKWLLEQGRADSTVYYRISALSSLFAFLRRPQGTTDESLIQSNPFELVNRSDIKPTAYGRSKAMAWEDFLAIVEKIPMTPQGMRDKAILLFFAFTGRRRAEVASLCLKDLDLKARPRTYTTKVKGGEVKKFELPDIVYDALRAYWIAADRLDDLTMESGVFTAMCDTPLTRDLNVDRPMSKRSMNDILARWATKAGVKDAHVHGLRHMAARDLDRGGVRLQDIQAFLGHASPNTTAIYIQRLGQVASAHQSVLTAVRANVAEVVRGLRPKDAA